MASSSSSSSKSRSSALGKALRKSLNLTWAHEGVAAAEPHWATRHRPRAVKSQAGCTIGSRAGERRVAELQGCSRRNGTASPCLSSNFLKIRMALDVSW